MSISTIHQTKELTQQVKQQRTERFIFALQLHDGRYVIGSGTNAAKRIAAINSGLNKFIPQSLMVNRVLDIKPETEERSLPSVVAKFCDRFGEDRVIVV